MLPQMLFLQRLFGKRFQHLVPVRTANHLFVIRFPELRRECSKRLRSSARIHRHPLCDCIAIRRVALVERLHPSRQICHIVRAADELPGLLLEPISSIRRMARRQNGGTILQRNPDHGRIGRSGDFDFVPERAPHQTPR